MKICSLLHFMNLTQFYDIVSYSSRKPSHEVGIESFESCDEDENEKKIFSIGRVGVGGRRLLKFFRSQKQQFTQYVVRMKRVVN